MIDILKLQTKRAETDWAVRVRYSRGWLYHPCQTGALQAEYVAKELAKDHHTVEVLFMGKLWMVGGHVQVGDRNYNYERPTTEGVRSMAAGAGSA